MTDKIRVGIVGATVTQGGSGWGANAHVPALKALLDVDFNLAVQRHKLIDAIERSSATGRSVKLVQ